MNSILLNKKMREENRQKFDWETCPETSTKNAVKEFHLRWNMEYFWFL